MLWRGSIYRTQVTPAWWPQLHEEPREGQVKPIPLLLQVHLCFIAKPSGRGALDQKKLHDPKRQGSAIVSVFSSSHVKKKTYSAGPRFGNQRMNSKVSLEKVQTQAVTLQLAHGSPSVSRCASLGDHRLQPPVCWLGELERTKQTRQRAQEAFTLKAPEKKRGISRRCSCCAPSPPYTHMSPTQPTQFAAVLSISSCGPRSQQQRSEFQPDTGTESSEK